MQGLSELWTSNYWYISPVFQIFPVEINISVDHSFFIMVYASCEAKFTFDIVTVQG